MMRNKEGLNWKRSYQEAKDNPAENMQQPAEGESGEKKSLYEIGNQKRKALLEKGSTRWQNMKKWLKDKAIAGTNYALSAPEAAKIAGQKFAESASSGVVRLEKGIDTVLDAPGKAARAGMEMANRGKQAFEGAIDNAGNYVLEKYNNLKERGEKAYGDLQDKVAGVKTVFFDKINGWRDARLDSKLARQQANQELSLLQKENEVKRLEQLKAEIAQGKADLERTRNMRARLATQRETSRPVYEGSAAAAAA